MLPTHGFHFEVLHSDAHTAARRSRLKTPRGTVELPAFMPVGTQGTVKGLSVDHVRQTQAEMVLANAYHLALRPGADFVRKLGGLHAFMGWDGPILTDSGGFQLFSLARISKVTDEGAEFRSHIDGALMHVSPERSLEIQGQLGSDIAMAFDHLVSLPNDPEVIADATGRTVRWAARCLEVDRPPGQALFGIVQGGLQESLRVSCAEELGKLGFDGYAVGGLSVGESQEAMFSTLDFTVPAMPADRPRYLMGVGTPADILGAILRGIDLFDCVIPSRNGRNALAYSDRGVLRLRNQCHQLDDRPIDEQCRCIACRHSRGYLRHLFMAREMLGPILLSIHNLTYYQLLLEGAREAIRQDKYREFVEGKLAGWSASVQE